MRVDLAIIGSGFGGSVLAMAARRIGLTVALIEKGEHPRFAIGESTSPLTNLLIETLAHRYDLPRLLPLTTWGAWKKAYPQIGVGLKRGFTYFAHRPGERYGRCPDRSDQLAVAASPGDACADTHWLRADVDHFLLREALSLEVHYADRTRIERAEPYDGRWRLSCRREEMAWEFDADFLVDASGPGGFLAGALELRDIGFKGFPATQALYSHFEDVRRADTIPEFQTPGAPPYPLDDAALHHVFPGGWMWVLRFDNGITSAGFAVEEWLARELNLADRDGAWARFMERFPSIGAHLAGARATLPLVHAPRLAFRRERAAGLRNGAPWALLPSAAGFIDPLYSTGFSLTLLGIERLARLLETGPPDMAALAEYEATTFQELDWVSHYVGANYAAFDHFPRFVDTSMFYFVAASYAEMARRLDRVERAQGFLMAASTPFRTRFEICQTNLDAKVSEALSPWNVAGLCDPRKRNWYGVDLRDVVRGAYKLAYTPDEMTARLAKAEWARCE